MWTLEILQRIEGEEDIFSIRKNLNLKEYEFRAAIKTLKSLGIPIVRRGKYYVIVDRQPQRLAYKNISELLIIMKETVKVLRFLYGDEVHYLWPNKVMRGKEVLIELVGNDVVHNLPSYIYFVITTRANTSLKNRRRFSEVIRTLNALLYPDEVSIKLRQGNMISGKLINIDFSGSARVGNIRVGPDEVDSVSPL